MRTPKAHQAAHGENGAVAEQLDVVAREVAVRPARADERHWMVENGNRHPRHGSLGEDGLPVRACQQRRHEQRRRLGRHQGAGRIEPASTLCSRGGRILPT